jgi:molybdate transport system ATP-binding protein
MMPVVGSSTSSPATQARTLSASIRKRRAGAFVLVLSLTAAPGITMVFGASGSGKTTLLRCLAGLLTPDEGQIAIGDRVLFDAARGIDTPAPRRRIGYVFQQLALFPHLTVQQNLEYGLAPIAAALRRERTQAIADSFKISHLLDRAPGAISGGERQRVALARSLVTDPCLLLLDEPLSALDYVTQSRIIEDLRRWNAARDIPVLYVTHSHRELFALGERVIVLHGGTIVADGTPHDVIEAPGHETVAQLAGFENFLDAHVLTVRADAGTMQCRLDQTGTELEVPLALAAPGAPVRIAIRAGDIMVAAEQPRGLSARNVLAGTIESLMRDGITVVAQIRAGVRFEVHLTPGACESLGLAAGQQVWLVIKTHSCRLVSAASSEE